MTTHIRATDMILGHRATKLKKLLASWEKGNRQPKTLARLAGIELSPAAVASILAESYDRGFIARIVENDWKKFALTPAGEGIVGASARKRSSKSSAKKVLDEILVRAQALALDPYAPGEADKIWVFGSYIDPAKTDVGDIDIVIERKATSVGKNVELGHMAKYISLHYPGVLSENETSPFSTFTWFDRMLYGPRRHPLISPSEIATLKGLHVPCILVYAADRGGIIEPVHYDHHPDSVCRAAWVNERLVMPSFDTPVTDYEFASADIVSRLFEDNYSIQPEDVFTNIMALPLRFRRKAVGLPCDGRNGFFFIFRNSGDEALLHVTRTVEFGSSEWGYQMKVDLVQRSGKTKVEDWDVSRPTEVLNMLFLADAVRLSDRRARLGGYEAIYAEMVLGKRAQGLSEVTRAAYRSCYQSYSQATRKLFPVSQHFGIDLLWNGAGFGYGLSGFPG